MNVYAVFVTYETDVANLDRILQAVRPQCAFVAVDNSNDETRARLIEDCVTRNGGTYLCMAGNKGIGAAQNHGIAAAWATGADAVLLLDDDSMPAHDLVARLIEGLAQLEQPAVIGAVAVDTLGRDISNARQAVGALPRCRDMMSSGSMIGRAIFERVGPFDERLFIDCVDFDWGWRAQRLGIALHLCRSATITHRLGDGRRAGVRFPSPIRHYYQFRNILRMMSRPHTPWAWRVAQAGKLVIKLALMPLVMPESSRRLSFALAGMRDALRGRSGAWSDRSARATQARQTP
jgi:rhamnosyltransferase